MPKIFHTCQNFNPLTIAQTFQLIPEKSIMLIKVENFTSREETENFLQAFVYFLRKEYKNSTQKSESLEKNIENLLNKANQWLKQELIEDLNLDICLIFLKKDEVYFAKTGEMESLLVERDKIIDLCPEKIKEKFSQLVSGNLEKNDILIFANDEFFKIFPREDFQKLTDFNGEETISRVEKRLKEKKVNFAFALIKSEEADEKKERAEEKVEETPKTVKIENEKEKTETIATGLFAIKKEKMEIPEGIRPEKEAIVQSPRKKIKFSKSKKNFVTAGVVVLCLALIGAFIQTTFLLNKNAGQKAIQEKFEQVSAEIETKKAEFASTNDPQKIKSFLADFKTLFASLPPKISDEDKMKIQTIQQEIEVKKDEIFKIEKIEPQLALNLDNNDGNREVNQLLKQGTNLYFAATNEILKIDSNKLAGAATTVAPEKIFSFDENSSAEKLWTFDKDNLIVQQQDETYSFFNLIDKKTEKIEINQKEPREPLAMVGYQNKLYLFDGKTGQIFKYQKSLNGFAKEQPWLKQAELLPLNALDMAIDSNIYLLKKGELKKFYTGNPTAFETAEIYPDFSSIKKLQTGLEDKYLWLFDPANQRVIKLAKDGKLIKQFVFENLKNLKDFAVSEKENKIWLLDGNKVWEAKIE